MRGRYLLGLSNANRRAAGVVTGDEVEVEVEIDADPRVVVEPADFAHALEADPAARAAYDRLPYGRRRAYSTLVSMGTNTEGIDPSTRATPPPRRTPPSGREPSAELV